MSRGLGDVYKRQHERITNVEFLENLVETYYEINEEIADRIDTESE